jgi:hypothetical protein
MTKDKFMLFFVETDDVEMLGSFVINGKWYAPKYGCDTMNLLIEELESDKSLLSLAIDCRNKQKIYQTAKKQHCMEEVEAMIEAEAELDKLLEEIKPDELDNTF